MNVAIEISDDSGQMLAAQAGGVSREVLEAAAVETYGLGVLGAGSRDCRATARRRYRGRSRTPAGGVPLQLLQLPRGLVSRSDKLNMAVTMDRNFVERRDSGFYLVGSRVPIDRIVREYRDGEQPEAIRSHYPTLSLEQVNGAIAFYLDHKDEVEKVMAERARAEDDFRKAHPAPPHLKAKLERARQQLLARRS